MPLRLDCRAPDFAERFRALLAAKREASTDVEAAVRAIIADVAARGDRALVELSLKFDRVDLDRVGIKVTTEEIETAYAACDRRALDALALARDRIEAFHLRQKPADDRFVDALGVELGHRWTAIEAVGLYVPGGTAAYPSSVLMNAVPAKVAGVPRLVMTVPAPEGKLNPLVLAAAQLAGVDEVYRIGGAQAVAAQLKALPRGEIAGASWREFGAIILVRDLDEAVPLVDAVAPEHLQIETRDAERLAARVRNAGAIFLGHHTPEAIGDYVAGSNHVLPTARSARFSSGLGVLDFMKRTSILKLAPEGLRALAPAAIARAEAEGLDAHARSVAIRLNQ